MFARIILHGSLQELRSHGRGPEIRSPVERRASIKDVIEALGPPHTEVGQILADGEELDFNAQLVAGRVYDIFPLALPWDVTAPSMLRPVPLPGLAFLVDENAHRLAGLLRMIGMDAAGCRGLTDKDIARRAAAQGRIVLSKDRRLLRRKQIVFGRLVRGVHPWEQLREIVDLFGLRSRMRPFSRCIHCNVSLKERPKAEVLERLEPLTRKYYQVFQECPECQRVYWAGSHHARMRKRLQAFGISSEWSKTDFR